MPNKFNSTSYNIFKIIKYILSKKNFSISDIVLFLESENIYVENEAVYKYLRTLNKLGFVFEKNSKQKYKIIRMPFLFEFPNNNGMLNTLNVLAQSTLPKKAELYDKLVRFLPKNVETKLLPSGQDISVLEGFLRDALRLKLLLKKENAQEETLFELYDILQIKEGLGLQGYDVSKKEMTVYDANEILSIEQTPVKNKFYYKKQRATLKFFSKVAKSYVLKEEDELVEKTENELIINTFYYNKISLYKKILRYANNCEIISPISIRESFEKYLSDLYQMYDCPKIK